ncbi:energy transducer TonB [Luteibaculum oceani]|nr:energy transducer TonB [Luteibaculum oceani]
MKYFLLLLCTTIFCQVSFAQNANRDAKKYRKAKYLSVDRLPEFKRGNSAMFEYLSDNIIYPKEALINGEQGVVFVIFEVDTNGIIKDIEIAKGISPVLDAEAIRVVKSMSGKWKPGVKNGKLVRVKFNLPVRFFPSPDLRNAAIRENKRKQQD